MKGITFKFLFLVSTLVTLAFTQGIYEVPFSGFPTYGTPSGTFQDDTERIMDVWTNLVRVAPSNYKTDYLNKMVSDNTASNVFNTNKYPAKAPLFWNLNLNRAARAHSYDLSVNCNQALQHNDCNGTSTGTRLNKFGTSFSKSAWSAENTVNANQLSQYTFQCNLKKFYPMIAIGGFICEGYYSTTCKLGSCTADGTNDGHRSNIMSATNTQISTGNVWVGNYGITTQDFSSQATPYSPSATPLIATGSHIWNDMSNANSYRYIVFVNAPFATINSVQIFVNGVAETLTYYAGVSTKQGAYQSTVKTFTASTCDSYYFVLNYNSTLKYVYPQTGQYKVTDGATCTTNWVSSSTPATTAPTTTPTTLRPSTLTPSTLRPSTLTPSTRTPSTLTPTTLRPSTLIPSTRIPSTLTPSTITPTVTPTVTPTPTPTPTVYNTSICNAIYYNTTFRNAAFNNIAIKNTSFTLCSFTNTTFTNTSFSNSKISASSFSSTTFYNTVLDGVTFDGITSPGTPSKRFVEVETEEEKVVIHSARSNPDEDLSDNIKENKMKNRFLDSLGI